MFEIASFRAERFCVFFCRNCFPGAEQMGENRLILVFLDKVEPQFHFKILATALLRHCAKETCTSGQTKFGWRQVT